MKINNLSKITVVISMVATLMACNGKPADTTVVVEPAAPVIVEPVETAKEPESSSTKVTFDKNGVKLEAEKVEVKVEK